MTNAVPTKLPAKETSTSVMTTTIQRRILNHGTG